MGRHASIDGRRRRIAAWPIVLAVVVLLLVGLSITYVLIVNPDKKAAACTGNTVLPVTASPGSSRAITNAANAFNATNPIARSACISVSVTTLNGEQAVTALADGWKNVSTPAPALWIIDSAAQVAAVDASAPAMTAGHPNTPLATSPLVLAVRAVPGSAVTWSGLASGSVPLVLTLPDPRTNRASGYALETLVAASAGRTGQVVNASAVAGATILLQRLARAAPVSPSTTNTALSELSAGTSGFTAVPVIESELAEFNASNQHPLTAIYPSGPTAGDEVMAIPLTAAWVSKTMSDAAAAFDNFLGSAKGTAILTADNLRTDGRPAKAAGVDPTTAVTSLADADISVRAALATAWKAAQDTAPPAGEPTTPTPTPTPTKSTSAAPVKTTPPTITPPATAPSTKVTPTTTAPPGPAITFVLDASGSMNTPDGNQQRIMWMQAAVKADIGQSPTNLFGLWSFSTADGANGYTKLVSVGALTDKVDGATRAATLGSAIAGLTPGGDSWTYGAIKAAYGDAVNAAIDGRPNRVIVLTDGADTTPNLTRALLLADIAALAAQNRNVVLDIVGLSTDVNATAMTEIAQSGGGTFTSVTNLSTLQSTLLGLTG